MTNYYKKIFFLTLLIFAAQIVVAQTEYKVSAEGFTFGKPVGNTVKLTVFLSVSNIGSVEEFNGQIRNIKLTSKQDNSGSYILDDFKKIIDNDKESTGYSVFSLSYIVPVDASDLTLILPEIYGSLNIPITKDDYKKWIAKGNDAEDNANKNTSKATLFNQFRYGLSINSGLITSANDNLTSIGLAFHLGYRKFLNSSRTFSMMVWFEADGRFYPGASKLSNLEDFFGIDRNQFDLEDPSKENSSKLSATYLGIGIGFSKKFGRISPLFMVSIGEIISSCSLPSYKDKINGLIIKPNSEYTTSFDILKFDIGADINDLFSVKYSFLTCNLLNPFLHTKEKYQFHALNIGVFYEYIP